MFYFIFASKQACTQASMPALLIFSFLFICQANHDSFTYQHSLLISSQAFAASDNSISTNYGIKEFGAYSLIIGNLKNNTINSKISNQALTS